MQSRIMYIEDKSGGIDGTGRIGRVSFSKSGRSLYYGGKTFRSLGGRGIMGNYFEVESGDEYWISGCHRDGNDAIYGMTIEIDKDVRDEYWGQIRGQPENKHLGSFRSPGKY